MLDDIIAASFTVAKLLNDKQEQQQAQDTNKRRNSARRLKSRLGRFVAYNRTLCDTQHHHHSSDHPSPLNNKNPFQSGENSNFNESNNNNNVAAVKPASWFSKCLYSLRVKPLPTPRLITSKDPIFEYPSLTRGLKRRAKDETNLRQLSEQAVQARQSQNRERINHVYNKMCEIAYGKGVTPQEREDALVNMVVQDGHKKFFQGRGYVEIGAGHGQWARALAEEHGQRYNASSSSSLDNNNNNAEEFVLAFDNQSALPLNTGVYHAYTKPAHSYFYPNVRQNTTTNDALVQGTGRILLMVYPGPGNMAHEALVSYTALNQDLQDDVIVVYVGEGRSGANANDAFFDLLQSGDWILVKELEVLPPLGGKGYEKMFVFKLSRTTETDSSSSSSS
eukprot:CAMPEP_0118683896 /NCGR_PEP_ID=MMETSP0800-20121206/6318_1 /TAXON_ID=210618 ORGANISM="Striatella unipunctata, Strain CCMP2910" /NCGR_SAMPLE_ID=MMETSP0800 /ASSEMBLY_ACC=CAM_ASM_000638 /LENGTH=391 /DNA_ID=CAMNT_0006580493 /DNA_START=140 /DNA_END=1317 /DNA_ORIENTATION=+